MLLAGYYFLQILLGILLLPGLPLLLFSGKYRRRLPSRLGFGWPAIPPRNQGQACIWLHALSVGEVSSSLPLVTAMRKYFPQARLIVTTATASGEAMARQLLGPYVDCILPGPLDILPAVRLAVSRIKPDLYILVETDFWPGLLLLLHTKKIPALLVNGRISAASSARYQRFRLLLQPVFRCFSHLALQTKVDCDRMLQLGLPGHRLHTLGNLKYALPAAPAAVNEDIRQRLPKNCTLWVAGSTHAGEEQLILRSFCTVRRQFPQLFLLLAPRHPARSDEVCALAAGMGLNVARRSRPGTAGDLLLLDTIGELASCYHLAALAYVGGSLVAEGGHNPLEAAVAGIPILFGPHMEDFPEISAELLSSGAARQVSDQAELTMVLTTLLSQPELMQHMGTCSRQQMTDRDNLITSHIELIRRML